MQLESINISEIKTNPKNPRKIDKDKLQKLIKSIKDFPQMLELRPIVVDKDNVVLGGNMRLSALKELKHDTVKIVRAENLTDEQKDEFIIKDNVGFGDWDWDLLEQDWDAQKLTEWGLDLLDSKSLELPDEEEGEILPPKDCDVVAGDLIEFIIDKNTHRLLCGDSTVSTDVEKLCYGANLVLMVTDPPYGVNYDPAWRDGKDLGLGKRNTGTVKNDDASDWSQTYSLFTGNVAYVWHAGKYSGDVFTNLKDCDYEIISQVIWVKQHFALSRGDYHWQHEACWYAVRKGKAHNWQGARDQPTVWEIKNNNSFGNKDKEETLGHGTQKPLECMARPIRNNSQVGDIIYDPFLGSGTTLVAAQKLNRTCYGLEIDPVYCQQIIERVKKMFSDSVVKINGEPYG